MFKKLIFNIALIGILMHTTAIYADQPTSKFNKTKAISIDNHHSPHKIDIIKFDESDNEYEIAKQHEKEFNYSQWSRSMIQKQKMIKYKKQNINYEPGIKSIQAISPKSIGNFIPKNQKTTNNEVEVSSAKNPVSNGSFGFVGACANVILKSSDKIDGTLVLKFNPLHLGTVERSSLKVFYWNKAAKKFIKIKHSGISEHSSLNYVWAHITKPGIYAIIGRNADPKVTSFLKIVDGLKRFSDRNSERYLESLCDQIFCTERMNNRYCDICMDLISGIDSIPDIEIGSGDIDLYPTTPVWECFGPVNISGVIRQVIIDPLNHDKLYAAAHSGGIWRLDSVSRYPNVTWVPLTDTLHILDMKSIASAGNGELYAAGRFGDIFRSTDDGEHWDSFHLLDGEDSIKKLLIEPWRIMNLKPITLPNGNVLFLASRQKHIFAATEQGLYEFNNSALTWNQIPAFNGKNLNDIAFDPTHPDILYITDENGILKWERNKASAPVSRILDTSTSIGSSTTIFSQFSGGAIAVSGSTVIIKFKEGDPQHETGHILLYNGTTWKEITPSNNNGDMETQRNWANSIAIDPHHPDIILAGGVHLLRSTNGGNSWSNSIAGLHDDIQGIVFDPSIDGRVYISTDGGVFRSNDSGATWNNPTDSSRESISQNIQDGKNLNLNLITSQPFRISIQDHKILGTFDHWGHVGVRNLSSMQWESAPMGGNWEYATVFADPYIDNRFYFLNSGTMGINIFSSEEGHTFLGRISNFSTYGSLTHEVQHGPITIYQQGNTHTIAVVKDDNRTYTLMVTHDGNKTPYRNPQNVDEWLNQPTWNPAKICNGGICTDIKSNNNPIAQVVNAPNNPKKAYAITRNGDHLWVNDNILNDDGWSDINQSSSSILSSVCNSNGGIRQLLIDPEDDKKLYILGSGNRPQCNFLALSSNGGTSWNMLDWSTLSQTLPDSTLHTIIIPNDDPHTIYLGADTGVYVSNDLGQTWQAFYPDSLPNVRIRQIHKKDNYLYVVTYGRGIWRIHLR